MCHKNATQFKNEYTMALNCVHLYTNKGLIMVETITQAAFFEKVERLKEEGSIKVEMSNYRALDERMTFYCKEDGYFQITPERFMRNSLGCALCSSRQERKEQGNTSFIEAIEDTLGSEMARGINEDHKEVSEPSIERIMNHSLEQVSSFDSTQPANLYFVKIKDDEAYMLGVSNKSLQQQYPVDVLREIEPRLEVTFANGEEAELMDETICEKFSSSMLDVDSSSTLCVYFFEDLSDEIRGMLEESVLMEYV